MGGTNTQRATGGAAEKSTLGGGFARMASGGPHSTSHRGPCWWCCHTRRTVCVCVCWMLVQGLQKFSQILRVIVYETLHPELIGNVHCIDR